MKKGAILKFLRAIFVIVIAVVIAGALLKMRPRAERQASTHTAPMVRVMTAEAKKINMIVESFGTVRPREDLRLIAKVHGEIVSTDPVFSEGFFVKQGTALLTIDPRTYRLEVERNQVQIQQLQAEQQRIEQEIKNLKASIKISKSESALARAEYERLKALSKRAVVAPTTMEKSEQQYLGSLERLQNLENQMALTGPRMNQLLAQKKMAKVMLQKAELDLERTGIIAPYPGWIMEKAVETGQHVTIGQYLGRMYRHGEFDIEIKIAAKDLAWLPETLTPEEKLKAEVIFKTGTGQRKWEGWVSTAKAGMDEKTRMLPFVVEVDVPTEKATNHKIMQIRPGMFVTVRIQGREFNGVFEVPRHMVHVDDVIYLAKGNQLQIQKVRVLRRFKDKVYIDQGLNAGDAIVKTPLSGAMDGMQIRVRSD